MLKRRFDEAEDQDGPVFPDSLGGLRDPSNTTADTILDEAGLTARVIADQLGHSRPAMTQDVYLGRKVGSRRAAEALEAAGDM